MDGVPVELSAVIHTNLKSRYHPGRLDAVVHHALHASIGIPRTLPVFAGREVIGLVREGVFKPITMKQWCTFNRYADIDNAMKNGQDVKGYFNKTTTSTPNANIWTDAWPCGGLPAAGGYAGTSLTSYVYNNSTIGGLWTSMKTPGASQTMHMTGWRHIQQGGSVIGRAGIIYDRVLGYDSCSISSSISTCTNTVPATRYISAGDPGMLALATVNNNGPLGVTASNLTALHYTDNLGNTGVALVTNATLAWAVSSSSTSSTAGAQVALPASGPPFLPVNGGTSGMRKLEDFTSSANNGVGDVTFSLVHPMGFMWTPENSMLVEQELPRAMFNLEKIYSDACISFLYQVTGSSGPSWQGYVRGAFGP